MRGDVTRDKSQRESGSRHTTDGGEATCRGTQVASGEAGKGKERGSLWSLQAERSPANALTFAPRGLLWTAGLRPLGENTCVFQRQRPEQTRGSGQHRPSESQIQSYLPSSGPCDGSRGHSGQGDTAPGPLC